MRHKFDDLAEQETSAQRIRPSRLGYQVLHYGDIFGVECFTSSIQMGLGWLLELDVLTTSKAISGWGAKCDSDVIVLPHWDSMPSAP